MWKTWKTSTFVTILALLAGVLAFTNSPVEARPKYRTQFQRSYEKVAANHKINCFVCHKKLANGKIDKKHHNKYGEALEKALGAKNVKNVNKIKEAFGGVACSWLGMSMCLERRVRKLLESIFQGIKNTGGQAARGTRRLGPESEINITGRRPVS